MEIDTWLRRLSAELDVADIPLDGDTLHTLLDLARDAAHEVERPAAPLSSFLVGVAVGRGQSLGGAAAKATALLLEPEPPTAAPNDGETDGNADEAG